MFYFFISFSVFKHCIRLDLYEEDGSFVRPFLEVVSNLSLYSKNIAISSNPATKYDNELQKLKKNLIFLSVQNEMRNIHFKVLKLLEI